MVLSRSIDADTTGSEPRVGVVAIGRNEGDRLRRCLQSALTATSMVVYVDSGSTDGSLQVATELGASAFNLDVTLPFTAARARNEGARRLLQLFPSVGLIQFVDGDCEIVSGWIAAAIQFLELHPRVAAACGRRRERHPGHSVYNRLCDLEWDTPVGEAKSCGGDVMMRVEAWQQVGGYRDDLIAGEEPELCVRLRARGWKVWRLGTDMTLHDAAMSRWGQWWMRCVRAGFAYGEGARLHGAPPERHWVRESRSAWLWGAVLPGGLVLASLLIGPIALIGFLIYPLQMVKIAGRLQQRGGFRVTRAFFLVAGKFPEAQGLIKSWYKALRKQRSLLIEYK